MIEETVDLYDYFGAERKGATRGYLRCLRHEGLPEMGRSLLRPAMSVIKTAPVASFIILALVWLSGRFVPVLTAALIVLPLVWSNVHTGLRGCDRLLAEAAAAFKMPPGRRLLFLYLPSVLPYLSSAVCTGMGMAWKAGIAAEILCTPKAAIGSELYMSKIYFDTPALFAWTSVVIALSALIEALLRRLIGGRRVQL